MSTLRRIFWMASLVVFLGGCSGFRQVGDRRHVPDDPIHDITASLEVGDWVRLTLADEESVVGKVTELAANSLTLEIESDPPKIQKVPVRDILVLEKGNSGSTAGQAASVVLVTSLFVIIAAGLALSQFDTDFGGFDGEG